MRPPSHFLICKMRKINVLSRVAERIELANTYLSRAHGSTGRTATPRLASHARPAAYGDWGNPAPRPGSSCPLPSPPVPPSGPRRAPYLGCSQEGTARGFMRRRRQALQLRPGKNTRRGERGGTGPASAWCGRAGPLHTQQFTERKKQAQGRVRAPSKTGPCSGDSARHESKSGHTWRRPHTPAFPVASRSSSQGFLIFGMGFPRGSLGEINDPSPRPPKAEVTRPKASREAAARWAPLSIPTPVRAVQWGSCGHTCPNTSSVKAPDSSRNLHSCPF